MQVDFDRLVAQTEAVHRRSVARDAQREAIARQRLSEVHSEMAGEKDKVCVVSVVCVVCDWTLSSQIRSTTLRVASDKWSLASIFSCQDLMSRMT